MGIIIFLIGVGVEALLAVFCLTTSSYQCKVKSIARIVELVCFVVFAAIGIIEWSIRYYALAALLLTLALLSVISLIRRKKEERKFRVVRVILYAAGISMLIFAFTLPAIIFPQYKEIKPTGAYTVESAVYTYTDTERIETYGEAKSSRKLNIELWYPHDAEGVYPLIVFSHGAFGIRSSNETLYRELASHGYVVCSIDHTYHCLYTTDVEGNKTQIDKGYMKEVSAEDAQSDRQKSYEYYQKWMSVRTADIDFVIDQIINNTRSDNAAVYKLIDIEKIGVMGHSLGGSAALGIGRVRAGIGAVIALESPFLCDIEGVRDGEFVFVDKSYPVPLLNVYSDSSWDIIANRPQYAQNQALLSDTPKDVFNVHIKGSRHIGLTDLSLSSPYITRMLDGQKSSLTVEECLKTINKLTLDFFNCYLKGEGRFSTEETD